MSKTDTLVKLLAGGGAVYWVMGGGSSVGLPELPDWTPLAVGAVVAGGIVAHFAAGKILDLLPDEQFDVYLYEVRSDDGGYVEKWGMTADYWENVVVNRELNPLEKGSGHYECYRFDPDPDWWDDDETGGVVWGNWRGQPPDSQIVGNITVEDAWQEIREIKDGLEDDAAAARVLIEKYPSIMRRMDRERAIKWVQMVGDDVSGDVDGRDVDDILRDELPEDLVPRVLLDEDQDDEPENEVVENMTVGQAVGRLVDGDLGGVDAPTGPDAAASSSTDGAVATDGGPESG